MYTLYIQCPRKSKVDAVSLDLEFWMTVKHHVGVGNKRVVCRVVS